MKGIKLPAFAKGVVEFGKKNSTTIMSFAAVGGVILTAVLASKCGPKAGEVVKDYKEKKEAIKKANEPDDESGEVKEVKSEKEKKEELNKAKIEAGVGIAKAIWPVVVSGGVTCGLILGANHINLTKIAVLTGAYEAATGDISKYKEKLKDIVGEKKAEEVDEEFVKDKVTKAWGDGDPQIYPTGKGNETIFDVPSGRFFKSTQTAVDKAFQEISMELADRGQCWGDGASISVNELYDRFGLPDVKYGDVLCFKYGRRYKLEPKWGAYRMPDDTVVLSIDYDLDIVPKDDDYCKTL